VKIPSYVEMIRHLQSAAQPVHPTKVIGICLNTYDMDEAAAREAVAKAAEETGCRRRIPCGLIRHRWSMRLCGGYGSAINPLPSAMF